jgi:flagellar FliL protein
MADDGTRDIEGEEAPSGGRKKQILIIAGAVLLLAIGGGLAALFLTGADESAEDETVEVAEPVEEGPAIYVSMDPKFIVNLAPGGPAEMMQIALSVYTRDQAVADFITANDPMLRHYLNNLFESESSSELMTLDGKQKLQRSVQDLLTNKLHEMGQPGEIKGVYFTELVLQ